MPRSPGLSARVRSAESINAAASSSRPLLLGFPVLVELVCSCRCTLGSYSADLIRNLNRVPVWVGRSISKGRTFRLNGCGLARARLRESRPETTAAVHFSNLWLASRAPSVCRREPAECPPVPVSNALSAENLAADTDMRNGCCFGLSELYFGEPEARIQCPEFSFGLGWWTHFAGGQHRRSGVGSTYWRIQCIASAGTMMSRSISRLFDADVCDL